MHAPDSFVDLLSSSFRGRLRIRWSHERNEWHIEQFVKRGLFPGQKPPKRGAWDETRDAYIRERDGVVCVLAVRTSDRMPCPRCGTQLKVPFNVTEVLNCDFCRLRGKPHAIPAMFVPLNDHLINYLKSIDPTNPANEKLNEQLDRENAVLEERLADNAVDPTVAAFSDDYNRLVGIPTFGYGGIKRFKG
jgi:hypothetical protein